ncbi:Hypothetical protein SRAE_1000193000 [Strongyloides ratti]|uniref:Uncharacterized protein n=1 Tax=Strongyloides ratti TaxID=34506 RepID=A0A090L1V2_STRRB|nr:Hypothetical protein SRAE_1000193000 [Strongyloides ratti]CEF63672.1 Hypothetical protein SRAE_1000193000 [Strongyloides ratti]
MLILRTLGLEKRNTCVYAVYKAYQLSKNFGNCQLFDAYDGLKFLISNNPLNIKEFVIKNEDLSTDFKIISKTAL